MLHGLSAIPALFAALILRTDRQLVASLRDAGALSATTARALEPRYALARWRLARLQSVGAVGQTASGGLFLDASAWAAYRARRRGRVLIALTVTLPVAVALAYWLRRV